MIFDRTFWQEKIEEYWKERNIIWLAGVRRAGKTYLCESLNDIEYFDCELPRIRRMMEDPQSFLDGLKGKKIVIDEIHRLGNPSELLKIAADHYKNIKIIATGSSSLSASKKFKDTLTGRKREIWLTPMVLKDLDDFNKKDLTHRLLFGGLPPFFLNSKVKERDYQEWIDDYWAKDIQELFSLEKKYSFAKLLELLLINSGGIFDATKYASPCEASRVTITNYLAVLDATFVVHVIRPFSSHKPTEIVNAPKVYGFDTGFVCYFRGWMDLRPNDYGNLWEHFVLNEIHANLQNRKINYWRNKQGKEVDFVIQRRGKPPIAIECKWRSDKPDLSGLKAFHNIYNKCDLCVVANDVDKPFYQRFNDTKLFFCNLPELISYIS